MPRKDRMEIETLGIQEVYGYAQQVKLLKDRILIYIMFLTCSRISEALKMRKKDIILDSIDNHKVCIFKNLIVLKRKQLVIRSPPVIIHDDPYKEKMIQEILDYIALIPEPTNYLFPNSSRDSTHHRLMKVKINVRAIKGTGTDALIMDNYSTNLYPHYVRHCGVTYLVRKYPNFDSLKLTKFVGWKNSVMASTYYQTNYKDLVQSMR